MSDNPARSASHRWRRTNSESTLPFPRGSGLFGVRHLRGRALPNPSVAGHENGVAINLAYRARPQPAIRVEDIVHHISHRRTPADVLDAMLAKQTSPRL